MITESQEKLEIEEIEQGSKEEDTKEDGKEEDADASKENKSAMFKTIGHDDDDEEELNQEDIEFTEKEDKDK